MSKRFPKQLKEGYYLDHFNEMLDFVLNHSGHLLADEHHDFVERFRDQGFEEQCLFVRLVNRRGSVFRLDHINYDEIPELNSSIKKLKQAQLFRQVDVDDLKEYLNRWNRESLVGLIKADLSNLEDPPKLGSAKKIELIEYVEIHFDAQDILHNQSHPPAIALASERQLGYFLFLYFGRIQEGLTAFALRDLGIMKTRQGKLDFQARFRSREVALAAFHYSGLRHQIRGASASKLESLASGIDSWPLTDDLEVNSSRHRALHCLGRSVEKLISTESALPIYLVSDQFPATERAVRILYQQDRKDDAKTRLEAMIENPSSDEELIFAEDFYQRKYGKKKVGRLTELLRNADVLPLDETGREYPEAAAAGYLERAGAKAYHVENILWSQVFGIVFWQGLFSGDGPHSDFDRLPAGLSSEAFYHKNQEYINGQIEKLHQPGWFERQIGIVKEEITNVPNYMVMPVDYWFERAADLVALAPPNALGFVLADMAKNFRGTRSGFPDLMVIESDVIRFIEIKAEGDQLQRHQLAQIERLKRAGFQVEVARIQWTIDPDQEYVVVDVETTGGGSSWNRVTEIGAVKVRSGKIIDEWSSLINPQRPIPKNIQQLTGITDELVADSPLFEDIADEFRAFMGDAVFVGHRVKFDFDFIRAEYRKIDQLIRAATFCTVVESRRYFPGLKSYGLAKLCAEFGIELASHHRALCDARATAEILLKINQRREAIALEVEK